LSRDEFIKWRDKYVYETYGKNLFRDLKPFLKWLSEKFDNPVFKEYAEMLKWKGKKTTKLYTEEEEAITLDYIRKRIDMILDREWRKIRIKDRFAKLRAITVIVFGCSTGLRPFELTRLTDNEIRYGLKHGYFILPQEYTKTPFERLIPINSESKWLLSELIEIWDNKELRKKLQIRGNKVFPYSSVAGSQGIINQENIQLELDNLRDFTTQYGLSKLGVPGLLEAIVVGHDVNTYKIRIENYLKGKASKEEVAKDWLKYWDKVNILTSDQRSRVKLLISEIQP
jgi:hypothetical protein